jgi:hypothetical protein
MADTPLTDAEVMALKPDPQPKPAEEKKTTYGDGTSYEDMPVKPNGTKGTVHARSKDGPPLDADGNLIKKTQKQKDEENRKKGREILDQMAKQREELAAKEAAALAAKKAERDAIGIRDMVGIDIGFKLETPIGGPSSDPKTIGRPETPGEGDVSIGGTIDIGKMLGKQEGLKVTAKVRANLLKAAKKADLSEETQKSIDEKTKALEKAGVKVDEVKAEGAKIRDTAAQMGLEGKSPAEINAYATAAYADLARKYGAEAAEFAVWGPKGKPKE